jgi:hypothetical protein
MEKAGGDDRMAGPQIGSTSPSPIYVRARVLILFLDLL